jgi:hypothetical protein
MAPYFRGIIVSKIKNLFYVFVEVVNKAKRCKDWAFVGKATGTPCADHCSHKRAGLSSSARCLSGHTGNGFRLNGYEHASATPKSRQRTASASTEEVVHGDRDI